MDLLRQSILRRACVLGLLLSLGSGLAPVARATDGAALRDRLSTGALTPDVLAAVLEAEASGASLDALEATLAARLGDDARAQTLLRLLFGELLRIYRFDGGPQAVLVVAGPAAPVPAAGSTPGLTGASAPPVPAPRPQVAPFEGAAAPMPAPRLLRPSVQPLGP